MHCLPRNQAGLDSQVSQLSRRSVGLSGSALTSLFCSFSTRLVRRTTTFATSALLALGRAKGSGKVVCLICKRQIDVKSDNIMLFDLKTAMGTLPLKCSSDCGSHVELD